MTRRRERRDTRRRRTEIFRGLLAVVAAVIVMALIYHGSGVGGGSGPQGGSTASIPRSGSSAATGRAGAPGAASPGRGSPPSVTVTTGPAAPVQISRVPTPSMTAAAPSLVGWKLTLPVDAAGRSAGTAQQLESAAITPPWLVRTADGSLSFWAPAVGARTADSDHARTELVSTDDFVLGEATHTLAATVSVTQVPSTDPDVDIGQVHGAGTLVSVPFVMVHWRDDDIVVVIEQARAGSTTQSVTLLTGVPLGARFSYTITDRGDGTLSLTASSAGRAMGATIAIPTAFVGSDMRFQVGDYQQATTGTSSNDGARVVFDRIDAT